MEDIINEGILPGEISSLKTKDIGIILNQMKTSVCIIYPIIEGKLAGTGFFCKIPLRNKMIPCLLTNYHVLDEKYIKEYKKIIISMNDKTINEEISINEKDILYLSGKNEYDLIIIKLDRKENYINYLELDDNLFMNNSQLGYKNQSIYILHYPNSLMASISFGYGLLSNNISKYDIEHRCNTSPGSSGGPILNLLTNKVIGIHKGSVASRGFNLGTLLKYPLNTLKNEIRMKVKIDKYDVNEKIKIFNGKNSILYVDDKIIESENYFIPEKEGIFSIRLIIKNPNEDCSRMFQFCSRIIDMDLTSFDTTNVTNMYGMFSHCKNLKNLDLSSFNTKNVTNMSEMFEYCRNLENINLSSFDTSNVKDMEGMFYLCTNLINIDLSSFNTKNVHYIKWMFNNCWSLLSLDISSFDFIFCNLTEDMFHDCDHLKKLIMKKESYQRRYDSFEPLKYYVEIITV